MFQTTNQKRSAASLREKTLTDQEQQGRLLTEPSLEENRQQTVETVVSEFQMHSTGGSNSLLENQFQDQTKASWIILCDCASQCTT